MPGVRRREFVSLLGGAAVACPLAARAQQPTIPTVGFLSTASTASIAPFVEGFRRGLGAAGFVEGRNVAVEYRWADNQYDRLPTLAAKLVARHEVICLTLGCPNWCSASNDRPNFGAAAGRRTSLLVAPKIF